MKVKQVSVMVDLAPLLMNISLMVFIDTAIILENLSCVFKHYNACISLHKALGSKCNGKSNSGVMVVRMESGSDTLGWGAPLMLLWAVEV